MKRKNEENWANDIKRSIDKGRIGARRKIRKSKRKFFFFENVSGPTGHRSSKIAVLGSKKTCHGRAGTVLKSPEYTVMIHESWNSLVKRENVSE